MQQGMYGIPEDIDLSKIVGQFTTQLCLGAHDLQFDLGDVHFAIQSQVKLFKDGAELAAWEEGEWLPEEFRQIFNLEVSGVSIPNSKEIVIAFENGLAMHLYDNSEQYESMQIQIKGDPNILII